MFKQLKQDKKIKTFKKAYKSIKNPCSTEINGKIENEIDWNGIAFNQKIPKKSSD